ncbi:MAG: M60 family peptidase N-terminal accessory domain-containing protein [Candidatus Cryptobacteroides sp.]
MFNISKYLSVRCFLSIAMIAAFSLSVYSCAEKSIEEESFIETGGEEGEAGGGNPYWDWADRYPGVVSSMIDRVEGVNVKVRGGYEPFEFAPDSAVLQSTGLYAAGGDYITVEVPDGVTDLHCQIGIGYPLVDGQLRRRYYDVVRRYELHSGKNEVMSHFGGFLYFYYPAGKVAPSDIEVTVSGAVESDDFVLGETNRVEWMERMQARAALIKNPSEDDEEMAFLRWVELRSDKFILTAGVKEMSAIKDPEKLLENYGKVVDAYYAFAGFDNVNQMPMRVITDIQLPDAEQTVSMSAPKVERYGKYPIAFRRGLTDTAVEWEEKLLNHYYVLGIGDPTDGTSFLKPLLGFCDAVSPAWYNSDLMKWPVGKMSQRYLIAREGNIIQSDEVDYPGTIANLNKEYPRTSDARFTYPNCNEMGRTVMYMQLAQEYGWEMFPYLNKRSRELGFSYEKDPVILDQAANDFFVMTMSEYAGKNLYPFFKQWKFPCSEMAIKYMSNFDDFDEDEMFWKAYNAGKNPEFVARTPDLSYADKRPSGRLEFSMPTPDDLRNWFLFAALYNVDKSTPEKTVWSRQVNSLYNTDWNKAFDGDITKGIQILGHCQNKTNDTYANIPYCYLSFVGPGALSDLGEGIFTYPASKKPANNVSPNVFRIYIPEDTDLDSYSNEPLTFNTLMLVNSNQYYMTSYFYDIEYWDMEEEVWKPTSPSEHLLLYTHLYEAYYFDETYTTTRIRYKMQPITPGTSGYSICEYNEMNFGFVKEVPAG